MTGTVCQQAAEQASWDRHVDKALAVAMHPSQPKPRRLALLPGDGDDLTAPSGAHPAARALAKREESR